MKKKFLFLLSVAMNIAFAVYLLLRPAAPLADVGDQITPVAPPRIGSHNGEPEADSALKENTSTTDLIGMVEILRKAGASDYVLFSYASAVVGEKNREKRMELTHRGKRYQWEMLSATPPVGAELDEYNAIQKEEGEEIRALIGDASFYAMKSATLSADPSLKKVSVEKLAAIVDAMQEHRGLIMEARAQGKLDPNLKKALDDELESVVKESLSPEEYAAWRFSRSEDVRRLSTALRGLDISEEEFRTVATSVEAVHSDDEKIQAVRTSAGDAAAVRYVGAVRADFRSAASGLSSAGASDSLVLDTYAAYRKLRAKGADPRALYAEAVTRMTPEQKLAFDNSSAGTSFRTSIQVFELNEAALRKTGRP